MSSIAPRESSWRFIGVDSGPAPRPLLGRARDGTPDPRHSELSRGFRDLGSLSCRARKGRCRPNSDVSLNADEHPGGFVKVAGGGVPSFGSDMRGSSSLRAEAPEDLARPGSRRRNAVVNRGRRVRCRRARVIQREPFRRCRVGSRRAISGRAGVCSRALDPGSAPEQGRKHGPPRWAAIIERTR